MYERDLPFQGKVGVLIEEMMTKTGIYEYCSFTNAVKCCNIVQDKKNEWKFFSKTPNVKMTKACSGQLQADMKATDWDLIITFGNEATRAVLGKDASGINSMHGEIVDRSAEGLPAVLPVISPAIVLRTGGQNDYRKILYAFLKGKAYLHGQTMQDKVEEVKKTFTYLRSRKDIASAMKRFDEEPEWVVYDIENMGHVKKARDPENLLLCASISISKTETYFFPLYHKEGQDWRDPDVDAHMMFRALIYCLKKAKTIYTHNLSADTTPTFLQARHHLGVEWWDYPKFRDSIVLHYMVDRNSLHRADEIAKSLGYESYKDGPSSYLKSSGLPTGEKHYGNVPLDILGPYNCLDTAVIADFVDNTLKKLEINPLWRDCWESQLGPMSYTYTEIENNGTFIDVDYVNGLLTDYEKQQKDLLEQFVRMPDVMARLIECGLPVLDGRTPESIAEDFNPGSYIQINQLFYGDVTYVKKDRTTKEIIQHGSYKPAGLRIPPPSKVPGAHGFGFSIPTRLPYVSYVERHAVQFNLAQLVEHGEDVRLEFYDDGLGRLCRSYGKTKFDDPVDKLRRYYPIYILHEYAKLQKQVTGYLRPAAQKWVNPFSGLYHSPFKVHGTATGRLSAGIHTVPKMAKTQRMVRSRFDGGKILMYDYAAIEVRVLASFSEDAKLCEIFNDGKIDMHRRVASFAFKIPYDDITSNQRRVCKTVHFGLLYLESLESIAARVKQKGESFEESLARVVEFRDGYYREFPGVPAYIERMQYDLKKYGVCHPYKDQLKIARKYRPKDTNRYICTPTGRMLVCESDASAWDLKVRPVNWPIQSTASDMTARAVVKIQREFVKLGLRSKVFVSTHDSIGVDAHPDEAAFIHPLVISIMESPDDVFRFKVPAKADAEEGDTWGDVKELEDKGMKKGKAIQSSAAISL